ncbi:RNA polymerase sigma factor [Dactylosporangium sucinum]|uniref:DNA-directed RNA polymerase sigma-70 factor n=1 Tax=Dactylosporangium sucinum TaxID=1424081 RepID=A0A917UC76_9ACTN|nr:RNA polymerase sigma factor [Dactylosporangium sucinum]GGM80384.1 DNA-directed RNA polymerase sigma-70 factor [Dactylosporangium sucinum]
MEHPDEGRWFTALYGEFRPRVYAYAVSRVGRDLADDVVADTFLVVWRRLDAVPAVPLPWLLGVARNVIRERYREEVRQVSLAAEMRAWVEEAQADVADGVTEKAAMLAALARLGDDDRELLTLVAWHGLGAREAAKVVGCSTATYFVRLHRARKRLEQALAGSARRPPVSRPTQEYSR